MKELGKSTDCIEIILTTVVRVSMRINLVYTHINNFCFSFNAAKEVRPKFLVITTKMIYDKSFTSKTHTHMSTSILTRHLNDVLVIIVKVSGPRIIAKPHRKVYSFTFILAKYNIRTNRVNDYL